MVGLARERRRGDEHPSVCPTPSVIIIPFNKISGVSQANKILLIFILCLNLKTTAGAPVCREGQEKGGQGRGL